MIEKTGNENRRTFQRNSARRVIILLKDQPFLAVDWSPDGFSINFPDSGYAEGDIILGEIDIFEVEEIGLFTASIIRVSEAGALAARFMKLSSHSYMNLCLTLSMPEEEFS